MKKLAYLLVFLLLPLTGCEEKTNRTVSDLTIGNGYYNVALPFKTSVSNNYIANNFMNTYDLEEVEISLMELSSLYYHTDSSFYQDGQYLTVEDMDTLLSKDYLNNYPKITIDTVTIDPYYVTGLFEQNYLDQENHLKGISVGIILSPYQKYKNDYGTYLYKEVPESEILEIGEEVSKKLLSYLREKEDLKTSKILLALYVQNSPDATTPGSYKKYGITVNNEITFKNTSKKYSYLTSTEVLQNNGELYNAFKVLQADIKKVLPKVSLMGTVKYQDEMVTDVTIHMTASYLNKSEVLLLTSLVKESILANFPSTIPFTIYIKENDTIHALLLKKKTDSDIIIHILEEK